MEKSGTFLFFHGLLYLHLRVPPNYSTYICSTHFCSADYCSTFDLLYLQLCGVVPATFCTAHFCSVQFCYTTILFNSVLFCRFFIPPRHLCMYTCVEASLQLPCFTHFYCACFILPIIIPHFCSTMTILHLMCNNHFFSTFFVLLFIVSRVELWGGYGKSMCLSQKVALQALQYITGTQLIQITCDGYFQPTTVEWVHDMVWCVSGPIWTQNNDVISG